ncbi:alpha-ribazole phosphatase [Paraburkholderia terricola]|jgi:alpha-ribazole phosphatase|uniref:Alpha-ribazole phosphatase n=1 Tax=Paraburkholderia terricola TaxID=169427 RepID=A0A1M6WLF9_9BURK|nr:MULTISPECIES: alpha-ribazole phosphatase [Paraburkholderia]MDR6407484.1 alpha-ribazole phosphatase [Paraburkholderia terricola]MDR6445448.1 alpha-ribazole phosphatase [Paraburkholderia terricola]MDR6480301.1 alpha-ribazole phosphatase [Paraburkholderia terricola]SDP19964.1 alpha-ribazole phosphatase [Paraburkholderia sediminicola]SHK94557.1 alpha-ribazole phosphatase [Paraburkholderia terricola]
MDIVLIRHPAVVVDAGVCYGQSDVALVEDADVSSAALALRLAALQVPAPRVLMSSPSTRCSALAAAMSNDFGCALSHDDRLKEMNFGDWEERRWDAIDRELLDDWAANFEHARAHGGESVTQFVARVRAWFDAFAQTRELTPAYVVTHAGVMRAIASLVLDVPLERCLRWSLDMTGIVWLRRDDEARQWSLVRWNA